MTAANYTLTNANGVADEAKSMFLVLGGTPGASFAVIVPSVSKLYFVTNNTGFAQTVRTSGTGISVPNGASMTLRCDGTNVVVAQNYFLFTSGSAALPSVAISGDADTGMWSPAANTLAWSNNGAETMRLDSSGNLGLGVTPSAWAAGSTVIETGNQVSYSRYGYIRNAYWNGSNYIYTTTGTASYYQQATGVHTWYSAPSGTAGNTISFTQTMTLDVSGNLGVGTTSPGAKLHINSGASDEVARFEGTGEPFISLYDNGTRDFYLFDTTEIRMWGQANKAMAFATNNTERARITPGGEVYIAGTTDQGAYNLQVNGTGVWGAGAYVNGSDERLKEDITAIDAALDVVNMLRPVTFRYKETHSKDQSIQPGFIAQELQIAMAGKAYVDGVVHSGPEYLNVAYQSLIPLLTKAIQEQQALITSLTARVAALEQA
jgi:hypothetical protein